MTITEKIGAYFDGLIAEGKLSPGDRLPGYMEICRLFSIPYSSAQRAYKNLEHSGKIKIRNGIGSFLNGGDMLDVEFRLTKTTFDFPAMERLVNAIARENELNLNIIVKDAAGEDLQTCFQDHKVVLFEKSPFWSSLGSMLDYSEFEDYEEVVSQFETRDISLNHMRLPFYSFTYQGAVNTAILEKIGFEREITRFDTLPWWDELAEKCRRHGVPPAMKLMLRKHMWGQPFLAPMELLRLQDGYSADALFTPPCFTTETGKRVFEMLKACKPYDDPSRNFFTQNAALDFSVGSWACTQYKKIGFPEEHFRIVPLMRGEQRVLRYGLYCLETFINTSITLNEKQRIWKLLKLLLSKKIQKMICSGCGAVSLRKDMEAGDYKWLVREDFRNFVPRKGDLLLPGQIPQSILAAALDAFYEAYENCHAESELIRRCMDEKLSCPGV